MGRRAPRPISAALAPMLASAAPATVLAAVQQSWRAELGEGIAAEAEPVSERDGVVTVACRSATWAAELQMMGPDLVARLRESGGAEGLRELRFRVSDA